jgi:VanZ family protein
MGERRIRAAGWWVAAALAWAALIGYLSSRPPAAILSEHPGLDKPVHVLVFGVLGVLVLFAVRHAGLRSLWHAALVSTLLVGVAGLADEAHQLVVPLRTFSPWDWLADAAGGALGAGAAVLVIGRLLR